MDKDKQLYDLLHSISDVLQTLNNRVDKLERETRIWDAETEIVNRQISKIQIGINQMFGFVPQIHPRSDEDGTANHD